MTGDNRGGNAIAIIHREQILARVAAGEYLATIADDLGVSPPAISKVISGDQEYQSAREAGIERRLAQRERELEAADDQVNLARARELLSHQRWRAEREFPARWGQRVQAAPVQVAVIVQGKLDQSAQSLIDALQHNTIAHDTYLPSEIKDVESE